MYVEAPFHVTLMTDGRLSSLRFPAKSSLQSVAAIIGADHGFQISSDVRIKVEVVSHTEGRGNVRIIHRGFAKRLLHLLGPYKQQSPPKKYTPSSLELKTWSHNFLPSKASTMHQVPEHHSGLVSHGRISTANAADHDITCRSRRFRCGGMKQSVGSIFDSTQKPQSKAGMTSMKRSNLSSPAPDLTLQRSTCHFGQWQATSSQNAQLQCVGVKQSRPTAELPKKAMGASSDDLTCTILSCDNDFSASKPASEISSASSFVRDAQSHSGLHYSSQSSFEKIALL